EWKTGLTPDSEAKIAAATSLPDLRDIGVCTRIWGRPYNPVPELRWLFDSALFRRIERARIGHVGPLDQLLLELEPKPNLREIEIVELWDVCLHNRPNGFHLRFARGSDERFSKLEVRWPRQAKLDDWHVRHVVASLGELRPDSLSALRIVVPSGDADLAALH